MLPLTDWAASILETHEDILVAVKKMWAEYCKKHSGVSLDEFTRLLEADARFQFEEGAEHTRDLDGWREAEIAAYVEEMEAQGFYSGPRVRLASREITAEHVSKMLKQHTDRMMSALWSAYEVRPEDLPEDQQQELLNLIAAAKRLQLDLLDALPPLPPSDTKSDDSPGPKRKKK